MLERELHGNRHFFPIPTHLQHSFLPTLQKVLPVSASTDVNQRLMVVYDWQLLNIEAGYYFTLS